MIRAGYMIRRRCIGFLLIFFVILVPAFYNIYNKPIYYKAAATIVFIGREGSFSPMAEAHRLKERRFLEGVNSEAKRALGHSLKASYLKNNIEVISQAPNQLTVVFVAESPAASQSIANIISRRFIAERQDALNQTSTRKSAALEALKRNLAKVRAALKSSRDELDVLKKGSKAADEERALLVKELAQLRSRRRDLLRLFTDAHPDVIDINEKIRLKEERLGRMPDNSYKYAEIEADIEKNRSAVSLLQSRYAEAKEALKNDKSFRWYAELAKEAEMPQRPAGRDKRLGYIISFLISLTAALFISLLMEALDKNIYNQDEARAILKCPGLGIVPKLPLAPRVKLKKERAPYQGIIRRLLINYPHNARVKRHYDKIYNNIRLNVFKPNAGKNTILISSSHPREGKTLIACNLAFAAAMNGSRVLFIDANLRRPAFNHIFDLDKDAPGLTNILLGSADANGAVRNLTDLLLSGSLSLKEDKLKGLDNLKILSSGSSVSNPLSLLTGTELAGFIKDAAKDYDLVIIDSASILDTPEMLDVMLEVDAVVLILKRARSRYPAASRTIAKIRDITAPFAGFILNN